MKLLVLTQKADKNDPNLGFFHSWLQKLAGQVEALTVICLQKGECQLPNNVKVLSLGKEQNKISNFKFQISKLKYIFLFYRYIVGYRKQYDSVFVHMNPEYAILGGLFWRLSGKKVLLWYTHKAVNWRLRLASVFASKIFTASKESCRISSDKALAVGHGIPIEQFSLRKPVSPGEPVRLLWVGRISPVKDLETVVKGISELKKSRPNISLDIVGKAITPIDREYEKMIVSLANRLGLQPLVHFLGGKSPAEMPAEYASHHSLIDTSKTGSIDKVVLEAMAAGLTVFTSSEAYGSFAELLVRFPSNNYQNLAQSIEKNLASAILSPNAEAREFVAKNFDLDRLIKQIILFFT